jgi:predicted Ser/Thr protein kinase
LTAAGEVAGLTRGNLSERTLATLRRGSWSSPDVVLVESERGPAVVKDFRPRAWIVRAIFGRWLIRHEVGIYRALDGHPAVPRLLGRLDSLAFVMEHRSGSRFSRRRPGTFSPRFVDELREAVHGLHARGVVHLDLRHRSNVRATPDGRPVLIDFDAALRFRKGSLAERLLLPLLRRIDDRGLAKWDEMASRGSRFGPIQSPEADLPAGTTSETGRVARRPM